jgi:hypothetical protein
MSLPGVKYAIYEAPQAMQQKRAERGIVQRPFSTASGNARRTLVKQATIITPNIGPSCTRNAPDNLPDPYYSFPII